MNYFELFNLPVSLLPDKEIVRRQYLQLSKQYHPDYHAQAGDAAQASALEMSATINKAFKTLNNKEATLQYVLQLKGLLADDEKYNLPPQFLMEMMDINEQVDELDSDDIAGKNGLQNQLREIEGNLYKPVASIIENYRDDIVTEPELQQVKEYYFKKKYLARIYTALEGKL